ncbi:hypothetical protein OG21DRAFT_1502138, partial [Imleria badia]
MQDSRYPPEIMDSVRDYAAHLAPTPPPEYEVVHAPIQPPRYTLPIRIVQFTQGDNRPPHWALFIPTSPTRGVGNFYENVGTLRTGYVLRYVVHARHPRWDSDERGSHLVGWVAPAFLDTLDRHFAGVRGQAGQAWVVAALRGLNQPQMYAVQME